MTTTQGQPSRRAVPDAVVDTAIDAALAWHSALAQTGAAPESWQAFTLWLESDPAHGAAFDLVEDLHNTLDKDAADILRALPPVQISPAVAGSRTHTYWLALGAAGVFAAACLALFLPRAHAPKAPAEPPKVYTAQAGQRRSVVLTDGTRVDLSPGSSLSVSETGTARLLRLQGGEALFSIRHDPARPALLLAAGLRIRDIGTVFDVAIRPAEVAVTVASGSVAVSPETAGPEAVRAITLSPGQRLVHRRASPGDTVEAADTVAALSWRDGFLSYQNATVGDVAADIGRYFGAQVVVGDAATGARRFSGVLKLETLDATLGRLTKLLGLSLVRHGDIVEVGQFGTGH